MERKPAAVCAVCRKPISKAADAQVIGGNIVHKECPIGSAVLNVLHDGARGFPYRPSLAGPDRK